MTPNDNSARIPTSGKKAGMLRGRLGHREVGGDIVVEDRVFGGGAGLSTNPCLDGIETLGSLMDIVEIGDVMEGAEQLEKTLGAVVDRLERRNVAISAGRVAAHSINFFRHSVPQSSTLPGSSTELHQEYAIPGYFETTNTQMFTDPHNMSGLGKGGK